MSRGLGDVYKRQQHLHSAHYAEDTVIVAAVFNGITVRCHNYSFCVRITARDRSVHICNIINFNMFEGQNYHTEVAAMIKGTNEVFSDKFSIHFFELKKISKHPKTSREQWLQFINADSMEDFEIVQATTNMPTIQKAVKVIYDMSEDTKIREIARLREKALHDEASALKQAKNEGIAMGRTDERNLIIEKMKASGMTEEQIKEILS